MLWLWALVAAIAALGCAVPSGASASTTQGSILQDDNQLIYSSPAHVAQVLDELVALGVQRVRISVLWALVAPRPKSMHRPRFDALDPAAYPAGAWDRYDTLVIAAHERGLGVELNITAPAPYWAATSRSPIADFRNTYSPSPTEFGKFVHAVGRRYSGDFIANPIPPPHPPQTILGIPLLGASDPRPPGPSPLPRVDLWGIYNEPDEGGWLTPQWRKLPNGHWIEAAPVIYRRIVDASWQALYATSHGTDTILIGETAARGANVPGIGPSMKPMPFVRALYCVNRSYRPLTGDRATQLDCPTSGSPYAFVTAHPGLFAATAWAHHPYSFHTPPWAHVSDHDTATLADLPRLERALDVIFARYGAGRPGGIPIYIDEWGYKSNPPNPFVEWSQAQQAEFINQGEYIAYNDPRVVSTAQFLLVDSPPKDGAAVGSKSYWSTFQTGLIGLSGRRKPAYASFRLPIWIPNPRRGPWMAVWGEIRPGLHAPVSNASVLIEYQESGIQAFTGIRAVTTTNPQGYFMAHVPIPEPGAVRLTWQAPDGTIYHSRTVQVH
jgi:hypothetical protein